jgi:hypothetical protein
MASTYTTNKHLEEPANGDYVNDWDVPVNSNWTAIDASLGGATTLTAVTGTTTLSVAQYQNLLLEVGGTLTNNVTYTLPSGVGGQWIYDTSNLTPGAYGVTLKSAGGGATLTLPSSTQGAVFSDGTNVKAVNSSVPGSFNVGGTLGVSGSITGALLSVGGNGAFGGSMSVTGDINAGGNINAGSVSVNGNGGFGGSMAVTGNINAGSVGVGGNGSFGGSMSVNGLYSGAFTSFYTTNGNCAAAGSNGIAFNPNGNVEIFSTTSVPLNIGSGVPGLVTFYNGNGTSTVVGSISTNGSSISYNTTSDYRLKNISGSLTGAVATVNSIPVYTGAYKTTPSVHRPMFLAHEIATYLPIAVTGAKDAVDANGAIVPQQVDYAALVPVLWAAVQELSAKLTAHGIG